MSIVLSSLLAGLGISPGYPLDTLPIQTLETPTVSLHYIIVPPDSGYALLPIVTKQLKPLPGIMLPLKKTALAAINGGFFDPSNQQTSSYITISGQRVADPHENGHLIVNPTLKPYLPAIFSKRSDFRVLTCGSKTHYEITPYDTPLPTDCQAVHRLQAGPNLFDANAAVTEGFVDTMDASRTRDPIGIDRPNARSGVGITQNGSVILAMAAMKPGGGVNLSQMADLMRKLGAVQAMALDGGSSATFWTPKGTLYGKLDTKGKTIRRPIQSALAVVINK